MVGIGYATCMMIIMEERIGGGGGGGGGGVGVSLGPSAVGGVSGGGRNSISKNGGGPPVNPSPQRLSLMGAVGGSDPHSPGDGEDGGFQERLIPPRKTSVETQTMTDDSYYQRKITPRVPKRKIKLKQ